jgi:hypothetical protein
MSKFLSAAELEAFVCTPIMDVEQERRATLTDEMLAEIEATEAPPEPETIPFSELLLLSLEQRFGRLVNAAETVAKFTAEGASNIERLTNHIVRLADALDNVSNTLGCITESVKGEDGEYRCFVRTHEHPNHGMMLSQRDERDTGED